MSAELKPVAPFEQPNTVRRNVAIAPLSILEVIQLRAVAVQTEQLELRLVLQVVEPRAQKEQTMSQVHRLLEQLAVVVIVPVVGKIVHTGQLQVGRKCPFVVVHTFVPYLGLVVDLHTRFHWLDMSSALWQWVGPSLVFL